MYDPIYMVFAKLALNGLAELFWGKTTTTSIPTKPIIMTTICKIPKSRTHIEYVLEGSSSGGDSCALGAHHVSIFSVRLKLSSSRHLQKKTHLGSKPQHQENDEGHEKASSEHRP
mmetsp:Transcript_27703/g.45026  ORF Transcript_27703/g.45026 Transcript_27703/m.45026 type:complete len:115 (+) Transcript_27703:1147-1491(+)